MLKKVTKLKFYQKNLLPQNVSLDMYHAVVTTAGNFVLKAEKIKKTCLFNVNNFFEMSCWTHRMQFWESWRKISPKVKNFLSSSAKKLRSNPSSLSKKLSSPKCFAGHLECSLHNADKIFDDSAKYFRSKCEKIYNIKILSKKYFSSKCFSGHVPCSCDNCRKFCAESRKNQKNMSFQCKQFFRNVLLDT